MVFTRKNNEELTKHWSQKELQKHKSIRKVAKHNRLSYSRVRRLLFGSNKFNFLKKKGRKTIINDLDSKQILKIIHKKT